MAAKSRPVLVVHCGGSHWADKIVEKLQNHFNIQAITLQDVLLSGNPLNLKSLVDNAVTVLFLEDKYLFHDSITSALVSYAKETGKAKPISFGNPGAGFTTEFQDFGILTYDYPIQTTFWDLLTAHILIKQMR